jgi:hypothetical protein
MLDIVDISNKLALQCILVSNATWFPVNRTNYL